jgi:uncharacterized protein YggT (Ycf19 family)
MSYPSSTLPQQPNFHNHLLADKTEDWFMLTREFLVFATYFVCSMLAVRGLMNIFAAGGHNRLAAFLTVVSNPLILPFKHMIRLDTGAFEIYTAVAIIFYALVGMALIKLLELFSGLYTYHMNEFSEEEK